MSTYLGVVEPTSLYRKALLINLGGGVSVHGGLLQVLLKEELIFSNSTTLMAMVDASIGGKLGIDFAFSKIKLTFQKSQKRTY